MSSIPISSRIPLRREPLHRRLADPLFGLVTYGLIGLSIFAIVYPLYFIVIASISDPNLVQQGKVVFFPRGITFEGYLTIFSTSTIVRGFANSVLYTVVGTALSVTMILTGAYALSRKDMPGRNLFMVLFVITMFFDGGMIARYLVVKDLGMLNTMWAVVLPGAVGVWNLIIARTFLEQNLSPELREAAQLDGASDFRFFFRIALPLSKPLIVLMVMIHLVANWNAFFDAMIYLNDESKYPLQLILRNVLIQSQASSSGMDMASMESTAAAQRMGELLKYSMIVVSTIPLLIAFPFLQRHFIKGATLGALKS
ncbi:carbohydrate ABC transporter permease [Brachybacterium sp. J144]|uniref:carbohydrate ABC transporter permease n=1 Tax=Brachybacterium sp. J144 TaxID=3116487 RepID=UPI002E79E0ED|nr:carbohydrate ABC transporter permease [Brachybacterium sp. J144]MEE1651413.1 carbohydrate ABC transporter permease [Brachybacterium sp. J144]